MPAVNYDTFNTGVDLSIIITDNATQLSISLGGFITEVESQGEHDIITIKPIDTPRNVNRIAYGNYRGTITIDRATGDLENLESQNAQDFFNSGTNHTYTIIGSVLNQADGSLDEYQFQNALIWLESSGTYRKDQSVQMKLQFLAEQKVAV